MRHLLLLALLITWVVATAPGVAHADVGASDRPPIGDRELPSDIGRESTGLNPTTRGEFHFTGTVLDRNERSLSGVEIKLFIGGLLADQHVTDSVGQYSFKRTIDFSRDQTVTLWFVDASRQLAPKAFVLAEAKAAQQNHLLSPCFTRLQRETTISTTIYLFDSETRAKQVSGLGCL